MADNPQHMKNLQIFVSDVEEGVSSNRYRRAKLQLLLAQVALDARARAQDRSNTSQASHDATPPRSKRQRSSRQRGDDVDEEENNDNGGSLPSSQRSPQRSPLSLMR